MDPELNQMMKQASKIVDYYDYLQQHTFYLLIDAFKKHKGILTRADDKSILEWRLKALAEMGGLTDKVVDFIAKNIGYSKQAIYDLIKDQGLKVARRMNSELSTALKQSMRGVSDNTVAIINAYADQTFRNVNNYVNQTLLTTNVQKNSALKTYQQIVDKTVLDVSTGSKTADRALKDNILQWYDKGLPTSLTDRGGHEWTLEGYTRTVITSTTHRVFNEARAQSMKEFGSVLATMSSHPAARPACAPIQGKVVCIVPKSDPKADLSYPNIYDYGYGKPAGTQGINCSHILYPYIKGVSHNFQKHYDQDPESVRKLNQSIRGYQAKLRRIVKDNDFLARQYDREQIVKAD